MEPEISPEAAQEAAKQAAAEAAAATSSTGKNKLPVMLIFFLEKYEEFQSKAVKEMYLRLLFPTLQKNESPFAILPQWLSVLGKKIDSAATTQDHLIRIKKPRPM